MHPRITAAVGYLWGLEYSEVELPLQASNYTDWHTLTIDNVERVLDELEDAACKALEGFSVTGEAALTDEERRLAALVYTLQECTSWAEAE